MANGVGKEEPPKHWLDHTSAYSAVGGLVLALVVAIGTHSVNEEAAEDRKLQWRPIVSLDIHASAAADREALGLFLENAGKGPARLEGACQVGGVFERFDIPGLQQNVGHIRPGAVIASGVTIPLLTYTPSVGKSWTGDSEAKVLGLFEQTKAWKLTVYYSSLYAADGCFKVRRTLVDGDWREQIEPHPCGDVRCEAGEQIAK